MSEHDLDRVQSDLAAIKALCIEPAVPREEIRVGLIATGCLSALAAAAWFVPMFWVKSATVVVVAIGTAIYVPWKRRVLKGDASRRRMEIKELVIWAVAALGGIAYIDVHRFVLPGGAGYGEDVWQHDAAAMVFFLGLGLLAGGFSHRLRRTYVVPGMLLMAAGLCVPLATRVTTTVTMLYGAAALACLAYAAGLVWLARSERSEDVLH